MEMESKLVIDALRGLKRDGVKYNIIARECNISPSCLYEYMRIGRIPLIERKRIIDYIKANFGEVFE